MGTIIEILASGLSLGAVYALVGLSLNIGYATTRVVSFAQGDIGMLVVAGTLYLSGKAGLPLGLWLVFCFGGAAIVAVVVDVVAVQAVSRRTGGTAYGWIVSTLGASIVLQNVTAMWFGSESKGFPSILPAHELHVLGADFPLSDLLIIALAAILIFGLGLAVARTQWGRTARAIAHNPAIAGACGVNVALLRVSVIVVAAVLVGVATVVIAPTTFVNAFMGTSLLLNGMVAIVFGGLGNVRGGLTGGLVLGVANAIAGRWLDSTLVPYVPFFMLLVWLMLGIEIRRGVRFGVRWVRPARGTGAA